ncbi:MAG TPA: hypothetical protein VNA25_07220 [Phycisphaerae bacterium]|nr:hypothetical protein [Phycisphaerae bacterium]
MGKHPAFFLQLGRMLRGVIRQELDKFVTEAMPVPLPLAPEIHGLESRNLEPPVPKTGPGLKLVELLPHGHAGFLHHHFCVIQIGEKRRQKRVDRRFVPNEQGNEFFVFRGL